MFVPSPVTDTFVKFGLAVMTVHCFFCPDSSNFSEDPEDSQSRQQKVNELLKNTSLKKDMHFALQQSLHDKLLHLGIEPVSLLLLLYTYGHY